MLAADPSRASQDNDELEIFASWALNQGVKVYNVKPVRFPGRGLGIAATRKIKAGDLLLEIPTKALLTKTCVPKTFKDKFPGITVHGLLAAYIAFCNDSLSSRQPWVQVWPSRTDFRESMPIQWPQELTGIPREALLQSTTRLTSTSGFLTRAVGGPQTLKAGATASSYGLLPKQVIKFQKDFASVRAAIPAANIDEYMYAWLIINTRTFYYVPDGQKAPSNPDDAMALCPFGDLFNHSDNGSTVTFESDGYSFKSDRDYDIGDEVYVSYGNHSNDFLLTEYGFVLDKNQWDTVDLDEQVLADLSSEEIKRLEINRYLGQYIIAQDGSCYRTGVAARLKVLSRPEWLKYIKGRLHERPDQEQKARETIQAWARHLVARADQALTGLAAQKSAETASARTTLERRWKQVQRFCEIVS